MRKKLHYNFQTMQKDIFWLPGALLALFLFLASIMDGNRPYDISRSFLGFLLPLISGSLASFAILQDPALELQFTTARSLWTIITERLGITLSAVGITALLYQAGANILGISLDPLGSILQRQLVWMIPCLATAGIGCAVSLLTASSTGGAAAISSLWITQLLLRGWFARDPIARNLLLFYGVMDPLGSPLLLNQVTLMLITTASASVIYLSLLKRERYI